MTPYFWLAAFVILSLFSVYTLFEFAKSLFKNKYMRPWFLTLFLLSAIMSYFAFYLFQTFALEKISSNVSFTVIASFFSAVAALVFIRATLKIMERVKKKEERLINLNFVLDSENQNRANEFENKADELSRKNDQLAQQAEILTEKEAELKKINAELVETQRQLEREKNSVEQKVIERTKELKKEKDMVEALLNQKNEFINQLSHDLRTPLTPLLNLLPFLEEKTKDKETLQLVEICIKNTKYLEKLVLSTLSLARLGAKNIALDLAKGSLYELLEEVTGTNQVNFRKSNVVIINDIERGIKIDFDKMRMREVFENLISNAIKYNESKQKKIIVTSKVKGNFIELNFTDNGIGIESKYLNMLFTEFFKIDPSRHQHESSGLGLSISKRIVELHKGKIMAFSEGLGKGTTITIQLPLTLK